MPPVFSRETPRVSVQDASHAGQGRTSPCECRCPAGNLIQKMERAIADGNEALALEYLRARNPFPGVTGRVCPHPCETGCNRNSYDEGVAIRALERHAADYGSAFRRMKRLPSTGKRIADCKASELKAIGFWVANENGQQLGRQLCRSVAEIEKETGFTFFPDADTSVKAQNSPEQWGF